MDNEVSITVLVEDRRNDESLLVLINAPKFAVYGAGPVKLDALALSNALDWYIANSGKHGGKL